MWMMVDGYWRSTDDEAVLDGVMEIASEFKLFLEVDGLLVHSR